MKSIKHDRICAIVRDAERRRRGIRTTNVEAPWSNATAEVAAAINAVRRDFFIASLLMGVSDR